MKNDVLNYAEVTERLHRLETQVRWYKGLALCFLAVFAGLTLVSQAGGLEPPGGGGSWGKVDDFYKINAEAIKAERIRVKRLELADTSDHIRALFNFSVGGEPQITLLNKKGKQVFTAGVTPAGGGYIEFDKQ